MLDGALRISRVDLSFSGSARHVFSIRVLSHCTWHMWTKLLKDTNTKIRAAERSACFSRFVVITRARRYGVVVGSQITPGTIFTCRSKRNIIIGCVFNFASFYYRCCVRSLVFGHGRRAQGAPGLYY